MRRTHPATRPSYSHLRGVHRLPAAGGVECCQVRLGQRGRAVGVWQSSPSLGSWNRLGSVGLVESLGPLWDGLGYLGPSGKGGILEHFPKKNDDGVEMEAGTGWLVPGSAHAGSSFLLKEAN